MSDAKLKVQSIVLVYAITIPGSGIAGAESLQTQKFPGLKMYLVADGVSVELGKTRALIPMGNIKVVVFE